MQVKLLYIRKSDNPKKKWVAVYEVDGKKLRRRFGSANMTDFTLGATDQQKKNYRARHKNDNINDPLAPGSLSWHLLWSSRDFKENIKSFKKRFNL